MKIISEMLMSFNNKSKKINCVMYMIGLGLTCILKIVIHSILDWKLTEWKCRTKCGMEYVILNKIMRVREKIEYE